MMKKTEFDEFATNYNDSLSKWVAITGESTDFYAYSRVKLVAGWLRKMNFAVHTILDFGCGVGTAIPFFQEFFGPHISITGTDVSLSSLEVAKAKHSAPNVFFLSVDDFEPTANYDLAYCNGVFHHIPLNERAVEVRRIFDVLRPGGFFAFWENNLWHPIVKYNMSHAAIDRNATPISPVGANKLLVSNGFRVMNTRFYFVFPSFLRGLRRFEDILSPFPLGAQYIVLCRRD